MSTDYSRDSGIKRELLGLQRPFNATLQTVGLAPPFQLRKREGLFPCCGGEAFIGKVRIECDECFLVHKIINNNFNIDAT